MKPAFASTATLLLTVLLCLPLAGQGPCREVPFEVVAEGFSFPEGPAFDSAGNLYVVNYKRIGDIAVIRPDGGTEVWLDLGESEANGMAYSPDGRIIACDDAKQRIISIDMKTKEVSVVVDSHEGGPFNRPNDIVLSDNGDIFFTDPDRVNETSGGRVFRYSQSERKLYLLVDGLAFPNGLAVAPDRSALYVASTVRRNVTRYPLIDSGRKAGPGQEIFLMSGGNGPDGIELDEKGNLYVTHYGRARVYYITTGGELIACATGFGASVTNVETRGEWLYVTEAQKGQVLRIKRSEFEGK